MKLKYDFCHASASLSDQMQLGGKCDTVCSLSDLFSFARELTALNAMLLHMSRATDRQEHRSAATGGMCSSCTMNQDQPHSTTKCVIEYSVCFAAPMLANATALWCYM